MSVRTTLYTPIVSYFSHQYTKDQVLRHLAADFALAIDAVEHEGSLSVDQQSVLEDRIMESFSHREHVHSTYLGHGVAMPHVSFNVPIDTQNHYSTFHAFAKPVPWSQERTEPVCLVHALIYPKGRSHESLELQKHFASMLHDDWCRNKLSKVGTSAELLTRVLHLKKDGIYLRDYLYVVDNQGPLDASRMSKRLRRYSRRGHPRLSV